MPSPTSVSLGQQRPASTNGDVNNMVFAMRQLIGKMQTATLVRVDAVTNNGGVSPVGFVDATPLVNQIDGDGNPTPHVTVHNLPYFRLQGGANAIIIDPEVGDIGLCVFASRDISKVKATKGQANPGSLRQYDFADGVYIGGVLNGTPTQYIEFSAAGIKVHSPVNVRVEAPTVDVVAGTSATVTAGTSATVTAPTVSVIASTLAAITAPAIKLGASGQSLLSFVTSTFQTLFNTHTHKVTAVGSDTNAPTQSMSGAQMTSTVLGG